MGKEGADGIFAPAERPDTHEYGYEPFPRQGLKVQAGGNLFR